MFEFFLGRRTAFWSLTAYCNPTAFNYSIHRQGYPLPQLTSRMAEIRQLYRSFIRIAAQLPTPERRAWVVGRVREEFRAPLRDCSIEMGRKQLSNLLLRPRALSLYRSLFRVARRMPTSNRAEFVRRKTRQSYEKDLDEADPNVVREVRGRGGVLRDEFQA